MAAAWPASGQPERSRAGQEAQVDFNGDTFADLAVGAPGEGVGGAAGAGAVNVLYGSAAGLTASSDVFTQGSGGVEGAAEQDDSFGAAVAKGNFNGDEFFDVAVGAPGERVGSVGFAGAVNVLYGSEDGLGGGPLFVQSNPESSDGFGGSLATADFNGDGFFDLAVGAAGENIGTVVDAGAVTVLFGSAGGITTAGSQTFWQGNGAAGSAETGDNFGFSVAPGLLAGNDARRPGRRGARRGRGLGAGGRRRQPAQRHGRRAGQRVPGHPGQPGGRRRLRVRRGHRRLRHNRR